MTNDQAPASPAVVVEVVPRDVIAETFGHEAVIVQLATGAYYSLDATRTSLYDALVGGMSIAEIVADGHIDEALVHDFAAYLVAEHLVTVVGEGTLPLRTVVDPPPGVEKFTDLADLIVLDPIHDIDLDGEGWPKSHSANGGAGAGA